MINRYNTFVKAINLSIDYLVLNLSMILAYAITGHTYNIGSAAQKYLPVVLVFNLVWLLAANITGMYEHVLNRDSIVTYRVVIKTYLLFLSLICVTILIVIGTQAYFITREYLFYAILLFGLFLSLWKLIFLGIRKSERRLLVDYRKVVIVGSGRIANDLFRYFSDSMEQGYNVVGIFDDNPYAVVRKDLYRGDSVECIDFVVNNNVDEIFCTLPSTETDKIQRLMKDADKNLIRFKFIPQYYDFGQKPTQVQSFGHIPVISTRPEPLENMLYRFVKRTFDVIFSTLVIILVISWLLPVLSVLIMMQTKGPVFFIQKRSGRNNKPFRCYKFRSMTVNEQSDSQQAIRGDTRITSIGAWMRRTNLDELPQFFNVLKGDMSVVGPRPHMISHTEQYSGLIDTFMVRHFLKPGITGWAQVLGYRGETKTTNAMQKRVEADVWYLENWSFLLDLKVIFLTVWNTFKGDKNAF